MEQFCKTYWFPRYAYVRRRGMRGWTPSPDSAFDRKWARVFSRPYET